MSSSTDRGARLTVVDAQARLFGALGDRTRLSLVARLCAAGPMSIARLTTGSEVTRQAVSKHLRVLEGAGVVTVRRRGRETVWDVERARLDEAGRFLDVLSAWWDDAPGRLKLARKSSR
jgi:DNA-binding transcriptional ArsR family regulator